MGVQESTAKLELEAPGYLARVLMQLPDDTQNLSQIEPQYSLDRKGAKGSLAVVILFSGNCFLSVPPTSALPCSPSGMLERFHPHGHGLRKSASLLEFLFKELIFPKTVAAPLVIYVCVSIQ